MGILKWTIVLGILLPFTGMAGFLFVLLARSTIEDAAGEDTWSAWGFHVAFLVLLAVAIGLFALLIYFVVSALLSGNTPLGG